MRQGGHEWARRLCVPIGMHMLHLGGDKWPSTFPCLDWSLLGKQQAVALDAQRSRAVAVQLALVSR